jgi:hypothetical protein
MPWPRPMPNIISSKDRRHDPTNVLTPNLTGGREKRCPLSDSPGKSAVGETERRVASIVRRRRRYNAAWMRGYRRNRRPPSTK